jgi:hypothetical protein
MFVRIASATERIFSAFTQRSRRPAAGLSTLCLPLVAALILPALYIAPCDAQPLRTRRTALPRNHVQAVPSALSPEKDAATPSGAQHLDFGFVKAGETSAEKKAIFTFNHTVTLGKIEVVTMGAANRDFKATGTGTCEVSRTYSAGDSCTVGVRSTPQFAGERKGAVVLKDLDGKTLGVQPLFDTASGAQLIFLPGTDSAISANANTSIPPTTPAVNTPTSASNPYSAWVQPEGIAVDGSGNVWVADSVLDNLYKIPYSGGSYSTPVLIDGDGLCSPYGVAVDGSGNVYVANADLTGSNFQNNDCSANVIEYPGGSTSGKKTIGVTSDFDSPNGVAVDGSGNVYVADYGLANNSGNGVWKITSSGTVQIGGTNTGPGNNNPYAVAVDSSGNVYVAVWVAFNSNGDATQGSVYKLKWNGGNSYTESLVGSAFVSPTGIVLDPAGDLYVSDDDFAADIPAGFVYKFTPNGSGGFNTPTQLISSLTVSGTTLAQFSPQDVAIDDSGNLIILNAISDSSATYSGIYKVDVTDPPTLNFGNQAVGTASAAQTVTLDNIGNGTLDFTDSLADLPTGYILGSGNNCSDTSLASGASCTLAIEFKPTVGGNTAQNGDVVLTATQEIAVTGTGTGTLNVAPAFTSVASTTFAVGTLGAFTVTASGTPSPTFSTTSALPSGVTFSSAGVLSGTPAVGTGGVYTLTLKATNTVSTVSQTFTLTVNESPAITTTSATFVVGTAGSITLAATGYPAPAFTVTTGTLPNGVSLSTSGVLSGTPAAGTGDTYPITITAGNGIGSNANQNFTLTVDQAPAITSNVSSATFTVGTAGSITLTASGFPAPTFSVTAGSLPNGVTLSSSGVLSGTPTVSGSFPITITASNGIGSNATLSFTLIAAQTPQTITFPLPVVEPVLVGGSASLSATTTSGLPVGFLSGTTSVCTITGSVGGSWSVSFIAIGQCSIEAYQWGNSTYKVAAPAFQNFYVHGLAQTITVTPITGTVTTSSAIGLSATASSSLPVAFTSRTPTTCVVVNVVGWQLVAGAKGTCTIVATQTGNSAYAEATPVTTTVLIHGQSQTITFPAITEPVTAGTSVTLEATASSALPVTYVSVHPTVCTVSSSGGVWSATLLTVGTCSIAAEQSGSPTFASAANVNQNFYVHPTP